jgi:hypothetical protein
MASNVLKNPFIRDLLDTGVGRRPSCAIIEQQRWEEMFVIGDR